MSPRERPHKSRQLAAQIARALDLALVGESTDEVLQNMTVASVEEAPGNRLNVTLTVHPPGSTMAKAEVMARLEAARPMLLDEVMRAVTRRSIPQLTFWLVKAGDDDA